MSELTVRQPSVIELYGNGSEIKALAERIRTCLPGGEKLSANDALALAQLSLAYGLNPFNGEVWLIPGKGAMVGIKGLRKAARWQAQYWTEHIPLTAQERQQYGIPENAIAYKCLVYRTDMIRQSAEAISLMRQAGMADAADRYAYRPTVGIGYATVNEQSRMKLDQLARKRAEADALKQAFDLPFAHEVGKPEERVGVVDAEWVEAQPEAESQPAPEPAVEPPARKPSDLLRLINARVQVPYENIHHLRNAIAQELGDGWAWPAYSDSAGWIAAYEAAIRHAQAKAEAG